MKGTYPMRYRFTIRDLLWLTLVVAMGVGWWLDHHQFEHQLERQLNAAIRDGESLARELDQTKRSLENAKQLLEDGASR